MSPCGLELIEMVIADHQGWDRYEAMHWQAVCQIGYVKTRMILMLMN